MTSIHPLSTAVSLNRVKGGAGACASCLQAPWTRRQLIAGLTHRDKRPFTLTFSPRVSFKPPIRLNVFGLWEEPGEPTQTREEHANSASDSSSVTQPPICHSFFKHSLPSSSQSSSPSATGTPTTHKFSQSENDNKASHSYRIKSQI